MVLWMTVCQPTRLPVYDRFQPNQEIGNGETPTSIHIHCTSEIFWAAYFNRTLPQPDLAKVGGELYSEYKLPFFWLFERGQRYTSWSMTYTQMSTSQRLVPSPSGEMALPFRV